MTIQKNSSVDVEDLSNYLNTSVLRYSYQKGFFGLENKKIGKTDKKFP